MTRWLWRAAWLLLIPLAKTMGDATEALAERMGPATGSLLNATFGNAAELIVGIAARRHGHVALVKGSLTGSILGNLLLVAGASIVTGGVRFTRLRFNRLAASSSVAPLFLAGGAMTGPTPPAGELPFVLISMTAPPLLFPRGTQKRAREDQKPLHATPAEAAAARRWPQ